MKTLSFLILLLGLLAPLRAERDSHGRPETARVVLYSGENFDGVSVELLPGAEIPDLGDLCFSDGRRVRDRISSVRVFGGLKVMLYADVGFGGDAVELTDSVGRLARVPRRGGNWDNCLSSVRVSGGHRENRNEGRDRQPRDRRDDDRSYDRDRTDRRDSDRSDDRDGHDRYRDDRARRDGPSGADIERMVSRAFRELLAREPNGAELRRYREAVFTEGWGRDEIYDDIRASREYRSREADRIITRGYRDLLGREPDPSGHEHWRKKIVDHGWTEGRFRDELRKSDEFRQKQYQPESGGRRH